MLPQSFCDGNRGCAVAVHLLCVESMPTNKRGWQTLFQGSSLSLVRASHESEGCCHGRLFSKSFIAALTSHITPRVPPPLFKNKIGFKRHNRSQRRACGELIKPTTPKRQLRGKQAICYSLPLPSSATASWVSETHNCKLSRSNCSISVVSR